MDLAAICVVYRTRPISLAKEGGGRAHGAGCRVSKSLVVFIVCHYRVVHVFVFTINTAHL